MKPKGSCETKSRRALQTDYCFRSDMGEWRGYWSAPGDEGGSAYRRFYDFTREFMLESARERAKEMYVWPVGYMIYSVIKLLLKGRPLD